ncbi:hypothetical protein [Moorena bouillonii]|nr:hypothetical protein [Moorena bouillonii]
MASWVIVNWTTITHYQKRVKIFSGRNPGELSSVLSHTMISISSTVFSLVLFASGAVASSLGPAMLIILLKRRTHYLALNSMMLAGLSTAILWRVLGFNNILSEVCPGFIVAVLVHELLMKSVFKPKGNAIGEGLRK